MEESIESCASETKEAEHKNDLHDNVRDEQVANAVEDGDEQKQNDKQEEQRGEGEHERVLRVTPATVQKLKSATS